MLALIQGTLDRNPLPELIYGAYRQRLTGALFLVSEDTRPEVYFREGYPCGVETGGTDPLDQVLLDAGLIDDGTFASIRQRGVADGLGLGRALIDDGKLTAEQFDGALRLQARRRLYRLFFIERADFTLHQGGHWVGLGGPQPLRVQPRRAIYQGLRSAWSPERLRRALGALEGKAVQLRADDVQLSRYGLSPGDQVVAAALLERPTTVEEVAAATGQLLSVVRAVVGALYYTAALAVTDAPERPAEARAPSSDAPPPEEGEAFPPEELTGYSTSAIAALAARAPREVDVHALREVIARKRTVFEEGDLFDVLGVERSADRSAIEAAFLGALTALRADRLDEPAMEPLRREVEPLLARIREAHNTLRDDARRAAYVARLGL